MMTHLPVLGRRIFLMLMVALCLPAVGCTIRYEAASTPMEDWPAHEKLVAGVQLVLTPEFATASVQRELMGDKYVYSVGPALAANAEALVSRGFSDATVTRGDPPKPPTALPTLTPKVTNIQHGAAVWALEEVDLTIDILWTLADRQGNILWAQTVRGVGRKTLGNAFTHKSDAKERMKRAVENVMSKSLVAITTARPAQQLAKP